ncbi:phosphoglycerate mutase-like protein [Delitschia confertaspora ATCC 74209]|uniref:Phosphoglycerate mutase-like protein n=1 Tax=Delitschia confertaspora ATCC 74209 TaxID=1513339 RepID=A0A9P4JPC6_9PLEO|nr:phosphoglycerate mutase-like protein [Delitschia confertaspora ATCC 74209]
MPPILYLVRHAEGFHNVNHSIHIRDATLTERGKEQCKVLKSSFPYHDKVSLVLSSPLRRAIQTAVLGLGPSISRPEVPYLVIPAAQEVSDVPADKGFPKEELQKHIAELFEKEDVGFDLSKIDYGAVEEGWNVKRGYWGEGKTAVTKRAADLRTWLFQRPESHVVLVTHGAFLHFLTEDWTGDDPKRGTGYHNCEMREFMFTPTSNEQEAHITETEESRKKRGPSCPEDDPIVLEELEATDRED